MNKIEPKLLRMEQVCYSAKRKQITTFIKKKKKKGNKLQITTYPSFSLAVSAFAMAKGRYSSDCTKK